DLAFFPYVRAAAAQEVTSTGEPVTKASQLIVFPGIELTLSSPPCQALLLLDAGFDETKFGDLLTALTITPVDASKGSIGAVDPVSPASVTSLKDLELKLNLHPWLKGHYIVLPNVTTNGHKTMFREGFHKHYKEMPCVG